MSASIAASTVRGLVVDASLEALVVAGSMAPVRGEEFGAISRSPLPVAGRVDAVQRSLLTVLLRQRADDLVALLCGAVAPLTGRVSRLGAGEKAVNALVEQAVGILIFCATSAAVALVLWQALLVGCGRSLVAQQGAQAARCLRLVDVGRRLVHTLPPLSTSRGPRRPGTRPQVSVPSDRRCREQRTSGRAASRLRYWDMGLVREPQGHLLGVTVLELPAELTSVRTARRALVGVCREARLSADLVASAELMISEVVTNAVIHGRSAVIVEVVVRGARLRVEVTDDGEGLPRVQPVDDAVASGRGLRIVGMLASDWGVAANTCGKTVWFELAVD